MRTSLVALVALFLLPPFPAHAQWVTNGSPLCLAPSNQFLPAMVPDGSGGAIIAWYDYRAGNADIYVQRMLSAGTADPAWPLDGRAVCTDSRDQFAPAVVADGSGGALIVWHDFRGGPTADIYAHRVLASGALDPAWPSGGLLACGNSGDQLKPVAVSDGAGGAIVAWYDYRVGLESEIYAQRVLASGAVDPAWPSNGLAICAAPGNQASPAIVSDGAGGAFIAWSDMRNGVESNIFAQHARVSGSVDPLWPVNGAVVCDAPASQSQPSLAVASAGGVIVTWFDYRNGLDSDIYALRVLATGAADPGWPVNGRALCTAADEQYSPVAVPDGAGGAIVTWYDLRNGVDYDIHAQHVLASGAVDAAWPADGVTLCAAGGDQTSPVLIADGAGGAVVTWMDGRPGPTTDLYATHVLASGARAPGWPADGGALCAAPFDQFSPAIAGDGAGGAIVAWSDYRSVGYISDLYAQRVSGTAVAGVPERGAAGVELGAPHPSPGRGAVSIPFALAAEARLTVTIFDPAGRRVRALAVGTFAVGPHRLVWDGRDDHGRNAGAGLFLLGFASRDGVTLGKVVRLE